jgi:hypothetical protein
MESNRLHHSKPYSNHNIKPHHGYLTSWWIEDQESEHSTQAKLNIIKMEDLYDTHDWRLSKTTQTQIPILKA